jgi:hypothetical protein
MQMFMCHLIIRLLLKRCKTKNNAFWWNSFQSIIYIIYSYTNLIFMKRIKTLNMQLI